MLLRAALLLATTAAAAAPPASARVAPDGAAAAGAASSAAVAPGDPTLALRFAPRAPCPLSGGPVELVNEAIAELLPEGALEQTLACLVDALRALRAGAAPGVAPDVEEIVRVNAVIVADALAPFLPGARRIIHNLEQVPVEWPPLDAPLPPPPARDRAISVTDGALTRAQCAAIVELFEASELYEGNVLQGGKITVDRKGKARWEYDVSNSHNNTAWAAWDRVFVGVVVRALARYEKANPMLRTLKTPFGDEGFRAIRYSARAPHVEHHTWHADGGQEPRGANPRILAAIIYLNEPGAGGETRFLNQGVAVVPKCGRVLLFPAAFPYVHAGTPVTEGNKYAVVLQITV
jgi:hypothetical protein